jgi:trans-aconitate methyltransferase
MKISQEDVLQFKHRYSDENRIIAEIIQQRLYDKFEEVIVDVGAGFGDITSIALPAKKVVQIDILEYSTYLSSRRHCRLVMDFFDYVPPQGEPVGTLFFSHVLQFLGRDPLLLNRKTQVLSPERVITVTNVNDEFMGDLLGWVTENLEAANPETELPDFPINYQLEEEIKFKGQVECRDYGSLRKQVGYLMDTCPSAPEERALESFLRENLEHPSFSINQTIKVYKKA